MSIRILFANILGGKEFLGTTYGETSFGNEILEKYLAIFNGYQPDILALAEIHLDDTGHSSMVDKIAQELNLPYYDFQGTDKSHITPGKLLGNAILSRFPIKESDKFVVKAPHIEIDRPNRDHWVLHDKGAQSVTLDVTGKTISIANLQYFPFHHFNRAMNEPEFAPERQLLVGYLTKANATFVTGDFNNKNISLEQAFPELFQAGFSEGIQTETTIVGDKQQLDHILFNPNRAKIINSEVITIPSDHFGLFVEVELL